MPKEIKLCKDESCTEITYRCYKCGSICCKHFCGNRSENGEAICGSCLIKIRDKGKVDATILT